ncbi:MAG: hypothetical protein KJT03_24130, partial [Verrucomicrobiae bacterium]|nr:hypothetical protein [Verrucomicrobiae bacterium]
MRFFIPFLFSVLMIHSANAVPGARVVERFGFKDAIELTNGTCTVVLTPAVGGKIMSYKLGEKEALEINPNERGDRKPEDGDEWNVNWAGRFDFGPETQVPSHPELWHGPWKGEITGPRQATLTSIRHEASGAQLVRTFTLAAKGSHLS